MARYKKEVIAEWIEMFGLPADDIKAFAGRYHEQKRVTNGRVDRNGHPICFNLTFEEWMTIWMQSGQLYNRGLRKGQYVMSRKNDTGHYSVGNVEIKLATDNVSEGSKHGHTKRTSSWNKGIPCRDEVKKKLSDYWTGKKRGPFSDEHRHKLSEAAKRRCSMRKEING